MSQSSIDHRSDCASKSCSDSLQQQKPKLLYYDKGDTYTINSSAPGKFIISGEYSVVYGKHAVAVSIDMRTSVCVRPNNHSDDSVRIELKDFNHIRSWPIALLKDYNLVSIRDEKLNLSDEILQKLNPLLDFRYITTENYCNNDSTGSNQQNCDNKESANCILKQNNNDVVGKSCHDAIVAFLLSYLSITDSYLCSQRPALDVLIESQLPIGCGLGSSSAYSVALCGALLKLTDTMSNPSATLVSEWAFQIDRYFHGTPSGIDNNIIAHGGSILFRQGKIIERKDNRMNGNSKALTSILVDTGVTRSTKTLCKKLATKLNDTDFDSQDLFCKFDKITISIWKELQSNQQYNKNLIDALLYDNQQLLDKLEVGHPALTDIIECCLKYGYRAKMTGAGGGGMAFFLVDSSSEMENLHELKSRLNSKGYRFYETTMGGKGLEIEFKNDINNQDID